MFKSTMPLYPNSFGSKYVDAFFLHAEEKVTPQKHNERVKSPTPFCQ